jgi:hypothetical protein
VNFICSDMAGAVSIDSEQERRTRQKANCEVAVIKACNFPNGQDKSGLLIDLEDSPSAMHAAC